MAKKYAMEIDARGFGDTGDRAVCLACALDEDLRNETAKHLTVWECTFCGATADDGDGEAPIAAAFEDFMEIVMNALTFAYHPAETALLWDKEDGWFGGTVIGSTEAAYDFCGYDVTDKVMEGIAEVITEEDWTEDDLAQLRPDEALRFTWEQFRDKVRYSSRFVFLSTPEEHSDHPDEFTTAEFLQELDRVLRAFGTVKTAPAGRRLWRGRLTPDPKQVREWNTAPELGPPPREVASNSRMSPAGVTMFYGAENVATAVAEIGAHSAKRFAILGEFETLRDLTLLDLTELPEIPSLYTETGRTFERYDLTFLHRFARDLAQPIELDGREHIEYVPTQVITEYLRYVSTNKVDGILYRSAQNDGVSCVLFCDARHCLVPGQQPDRFIQPWLLLHPETVHAVRVVAVPVSP
jgi:hypothetical protein